MRSYTVIAAVIIGLVAGDVASSAEIRVNYIDDGSSYITVYGDLLPDDGDRFTSTLMGSSAGGVFFRSNGGSIMAAIEIGRAIRLRGNITTFVGEGAVCASACALAWLAGSQRYMMGDNQIGFHAAYIESSGEKQIFVQRECARRRLLESAWLLTLHNILPYKPSSHRNTMANFFGRQIISD